MIRVTCAIIRNDENEVLTVRRGEKSDHPFKWEFPGGKVKERESEEECIIREIREELSIDIVICSRLEEIDFDYREKQVTLIPFVCDTLDDLPLLSEHIEYKWLSPRELKNVDFLAADIIVAENYIKKLNPADTDHKISSVSDTQETDEEGLRAMVTTIMGMKNAEWVATSAIDNPAIFRKLLEFSYSDDRKLAFHASWILSKVCDKFPEIIDPFLHSIIESLEKIDNESALRSFLRIISLSDFGKLNKKQHGLLAEHCFTALRSGFSAIAIKAYSMEIIYKLALIYPELAHELAATIILLENEGSAGVVARGRIILKKLGGISG